MSECDESCLICGVCKNQLKNPAILPCLHVFCLACLKDTSGDRSRDTFWCPLCAPEKAGVSHPCQPWFSFQTVLEEEEGREAFQTRLAELPGRDKFGDGGNGENETSSNLQHRRPSIEPFPCLAHPGQLIQQFCRKCQKLVCAKCIASFHRRCEDLTSLAEAVASKRSVFESLHQQIAANLVESQSIQEFEKRRLEEVESMKSKLLEEITSYSNNLIQTIKEKEKYLIDEVSRRTKEMKKEADQRQHEASNLSRALSKQLDLLDVSFCVNGEAELLPFLPTLSDEMESNSPPLAKSKSSNSHDQIVFTKDKQVLTSLTMSSLGSLQIRSGHNEWMEIQTRTQTTQNSKADLTLTLMNSFHGGCRDDFTEPLLTDLVLLANGDVILTDRDNKCVKKFKPCGKLLTRVELGAIPSRITIVSQGRAAVSAMDKKNIYFLSLLGTVRILECVKVKKIYPFITWLEKGCFVSATNQCDCVDVLNEKGELIQTLYSQKPDKMAICRPLYLSQESPFHLRNNGTQRKDNGIQKQEKATKHQNHQTPARASNVTVQTDTEVLVSDSGKKCLFKLSENGKTTLLIKSNDHVTLECPLGVTIHPTGLTLLCDRDRDVVLLLDKDGQFLKEILTSQNDLAKPCGIYSGYKGDVALTQVDGMVKIYKSIVESC